MDLEKQFDALKTKSKFEIYLEEGVMHYQKAYIFFQMATLELIKSKSLMVIEPTTTTDEYTTTEAEDEDEGEEETEHDNEHEKSRNIQFYGYLDADRVELLKSYLKPRSFAKEQSASPSPPRTTKYFDLHLPPKTKEKLVELFEPGIVEAFDTTPPPIPIEIIPSDYNIKLPDIGATRKKCDHPLADSTPFMNTLRHESMKNKPKIEPTQIHGDDDLNVKNPFYYPEDVPGFMIRAENKRLKKRLDFLKIPTFEKLNGVSLIQQLVTARIKPYQAEHAIIVDSAVYNKIVWEAQHGVNITRLQKVARKIHANYINYRKMIFYQEYGIHARNEAIKQMHDIESNEEMALKNYEYLSSYIRVSLDTFLRENEESANLAGKISEEKLKENIKLAQQVRALNLETSSMKNEITALNESLRGCKYYMKFLDGVARELMRRDEVEQYRKERREQQIKKDIADYMKEGMTLRQAQKAIKEKNKEYASAFKKTKAIMETESAEFIKKLAEEAKTQAQRLLIASRLNSILQIIEDSAHEGGTFDEVELFKELDLVGGTEREDREELAGLVFTKPAQLLNIYVDVEEQNLSLTQHAQINKEALENAEKNLQESRKATESRSRQLRDIINEIEQQIRDTSSRRTLKLLIDRSSGGYHDVICEQDMMRLLRHLANKVNKTSIGVNDTHLGAGVSQFFKRRLLGPEGSVNGDANSLKRQHDSDSNYSNDSSGSKKDKTESAKETEAEKPDIQPRPVEYYIKPGLNGILILESDDGTKMRFNVVENSNTPTYCMYKSIAQATGYSNKLKYVRSLLEEIEEKWDDPEVQEDLLRYFPQQNKFKPSDTLDDKKKTIIGEVKYGGGSAHFLQLLGKREKFNFTQVKQDEQDSSLFHIHKRRFDDDSLDTFPRYHFLFTNHGRFSGHCNYIIPVVENINLITGKMKGNFTK